MARILILDDEKDACDLVKRIARGMNHEAVAFTRERDAIEFCRSNRVDLAILDLKLRHMSGIEVFEALKKSNPHMKGLILTGYTTDDSASRARRAGASDYLMKPIDIDILEMRITEALAAATSQRDQMSSGDPARGSWSKGPGGGSGGCLEQ